jgi:hypothetical protein
MTKNEMRFLRRELINDCIHSSWHDGTKFSLSTIKRFVRYGEFSYYGFELKVYGVS